MQLTYLFVYSLPSLFYGLHMIFWDTYFQKLPYQPREVVSQKSFESFYGSKSSSFKVLMLIYIGLSHIPNSGMWVVAILEVSGVDFMIIILRSTNGKGDVVVDICLTLLTIGIKDHS